jgi:radical SAM protein with 4Fe4S-binding SPASM domain
MGMFAGIARCSEGVTRIKQYAEQREITLIHTFLPVKEYLDLLPLGWFAGISFAKHHDQCAGVLVDRELNGEVDVPGLAQYLGGKCVYLIEPSNSRCQHRFPDQFRASERFWIGSVDFEFKRFPRVISLCVQENQCFAKCRFCPQSYDPSYARYGAMGVGLFNKILSEIPDHDAITLRMTAGGEPLTFPNLHQWVRLAKEARPGLQVEYATNGVLLNRTACKEVVNSKLDRILVSLNAPTSADYEWFTGLNAFERVLKNLGYLRAAKITQGSSTPHVVVKLNSLKRWSGSIPGAQQRLANLADQVVVEPVLFCEHDQDLENTPETQPKLLPLVPTCTFLNHILTVLPDGRVMPCCANELTGESPEPVGNLNRQSIAEIWNGERIAKLRLMNSEGKPALESCARCSVNRPSIESDQLIKAKQRSTVWQ